MAKSDIRLTDGDTVEVIGRLALRTLLDTPGALTLENASGHEYNLTPGTGQLELDSAFALLDNDENEVIQLTQNGYLRLLQSGTLSLQNDEGKTTCSLRGGSGQLALSGHGGFIPELLLSNADDQQNASLDGEATLQLGKDVDLDGHGGDVFLGDGNGTDRVHFSANRDPLKGVKDSIRVFVDGREGVVRAGGGGSSGTYFAENDEGQKTGALFGSRGELVLGGTEWKETEVDQTDLQQLELEKVQEVVTEVPKVENLLKTNFQTFGGSGGSGSGSSGGNSGSGSGSSGGQSSGSGANSGSSADPLTDGTADAKTSGVTNAMADGGSDGSKRRYEKGGNGEKNDPLASATSDESDPVVGTEARAGSIAVRNSHDAVTGSLSGARGSLTVGGGSGEVGADGDVVVNNSTGITTCEIDGQDGRITVGDGSDGTIELKNVFGTRTGLFDSEDASVHLGVGVDPRKPAGSRVHLDGQDGSMELGDDVELEWDGSEGTLSVTKQGANGGDPLFEFDANSETLTVNGDVDVDGTSVSDLASRVADLESKVGN